MADKTTTGKSRNDGLDQMLARNFGPPDREVADMQSLEPSSGFVDSVMERVRQEARSAPSSASAPIAFPWRRAIPGMCMAVLAVIVCMGLLAKTAVGLLRMLSATSSGAMANARPWLSVAGQTGTRLQIGWVLLALMLALLPLVLARHLAGRSPRS